MTPTATVETAAVGTPASPTVPKRQAVPLNGVDTPRLFATIGVVKEQRDLARFRFRASNRWISGTHSRTQMEPFTGAGTEHAHKRQYVYDADHPEVLCGSDEGPTPVEMLLHALAACLTAGIGNIAAARGITLTEVESTVEGDIDLQGLLGLSDQVRNGYEQLRIHFRIRGDASAEKLRQVVEQSRSRSAVYDVLTNGTSISLLVDAE
jgi:uncharacterized OsmC-like protein